jgi:hypothetical protein
MLTGLFKSRQSVNVGGPIGSMKDATSKSLANPDYKAAYLLKRLTSYEADPNPGLDMSIDRYRPQDSRPDMDQAEKTAYLMNAVKGYEAEAEESLKLEFKDWLRGEHNDNNDPQPYDNSKGGLKRRDTRGERLDEWYPTWWGKKQLTHLPGVREYLREEHISADKASFDMNMLAHFGPQNLEEAWAYFKYWVKRRPVGPWIRLNQPDAFANNDTPFERSGPISMAPADAVLKVSGNTREGITKVHMPELARREAGNKTILDTALAEALKATAARNLVERDAEADVRGKQLVANVINLALQDADAREKADPFRTQYAAKLSEDVRNELRSEYERALKDAPKSRSDLLWRRFMMDNGRQMTREEYNAAQLYTDKNTNVKLEARLKKFESEFSGLGDDFNDIEKVAKKRFEHKGSCADHYHFDQLLLKKLDETEPQLRKLIARTDVVDEIAADVVDEMTKETQDEIAARDANLEARIQAIVEERLAERLAALGLPTIVEDEGERRKSPEPPGGRVGTHIRFEDEPLEGTQDEPLDETASESQETVQIQADPPRPIFRGSRERQLDFLEELERVESPKPPVIAKSVREKKKGNR